jgi:hypothetical protein
MTETELKLIAAAAPIMGLSSRPKNGSRIPAAMQHPLPKIESVLALRRLSDFYNRNMDKGT